MGFSVPDDLSLIGWDDSLISRVVHPPLTAITRDIGEYGATAARHLLAYIDGAPAADIEVARGELTPIQVSFGDAAQVTTPFCSAGERPRGSRSGRSGPGRCALRAGNPWCE